MSEHELQNTIRIQRAIKNLTQGELATMAGVTRKSVNAIETGRMVPSVVLALKLARALVVPIDNLFSLDESSSPTTATIAGDQE